MLPANFLVETRMIGGKEAPEFEPTGAAFEYEKDFLPLLYGKFSLFASSRAIVGLEERGKKGNQ